MLGSRREAQDESLAHLQTELEKTQLRMEEVAAYYRGELEAVRRRSEEETIRLQAAEVGRRKRAEEQVVYLTAEFKAARVEADHALRRLHELQQSLESLEQHSEEQARAEVDRQREATTIAWKTAEEEVERLDQELCELRRQFEREREERRQLECSHQQQEKTNSLAEQERSRLISRLKHALKRSEEHRRRAEAGRSALRPEGQVNPWSLVAPASTTNEVDPATGWGNVPLGTPGEMADEFLSVAEDRSLHASTPEQDPPEPESDSVTDSEAEVLMMELDVTEKVEQRHAAFVARQRSYGEHSPAVQTSSRAASFELTWKWLALVGAVIAFAVAAVILWF
ncbi:MAG: hypothetical protein L0H63_12100 [Nitrococcus sp.]|nr:hypothetical protein [Nitrococcus sp.]